MQFVSIALKTHFRLWRRIDNGGRRFDMLIRCPKLDFDVRFELSDSENGIKPLYDPFVRFSENSDFGSNSGTHSKSSGRSWKLRFLFRASPIHSLALCTKTSSKFLFVKKLPVAQSVPPKSHKSYRSSRTGYCSGSGPKMHPIPSGRLQHTY